MKISFFSKTAGAFSILSLLLTTAIFAFPIPLSATSTYQAQRIEQSHPEIPELSVGQTLEFWVKFKNTGQQYWSGSGTMAVTLRSVSGKKNKFTHLSWYNSYTLNRINPALTIYSGDEALFRFILSAPDQTGLHWEKFNLFAGTTMIPGGDIEIPIKVIGVLEPTPSVPTPEPTPEPEPTPTPEPEPEETFWQTISSEINISTNFLWPALPEGPEIRVGLLYVEEEEKNDYLPFKISTLNNQLYDIYDQNNKLLVRNTTGELVEIDYDYQINRYFINDSTGKRLLMTDSELKFQGANLIFKINSWQNGPFWDGGTNDNEFRDSLEIHYNPSTERLWLINQLPIETYLKGVSEASDSCSAEFLKAQTVAARTYATFRYLNHKYTNTPDETPLFTLRSTQADQVYRGYQREQRAPNTLSAAQSTKGVVATYHGDPISAYYFAQSDGQTLSSYEAGMTKASVDYLISKTDPPGQGKTQLGHGVGMPQRSAITAANQGANFSQILKYYYSGIDLTKIY